MDADGIAARVRELISSSGLSQGQFAAQSGMDDSKMSKALSGARRFTSLELANIAEMSGVSVDHLLGVDRPQPLMAARAVEATVTVLDAAVAEAQRIADAREDLSFLGWRERTVPRFQISGSARLLDQAAQLASDAVQHMSSCDFDEWETLEDRIERAFSVEVAAVQMSRGCDGLAWRDDLCAVIVVATSDNATRRRFTLAHELGHLLAGDDQGLHFDYDVMSARSPSELRANAFAAGFLMPTAFVGAQRKQWRGPMPEDEEFAHLSMQLRVSPSALAWRLFNLDMISEVRRKQLAALTTARCAQMTNGARRLAEWTEESQKPRVPQALANDLFKAYLDGMTTLRPYASLVGADVTDLREVFERPHDEFAGTASKDEPTFAP